MITVYVSDSQECKVVVFYVDNEVCSQTARIRVLISVFVGRTCQQVPFATLRFNNNLIYI